MNKKFSIGISLLCSEEFYKELFEKYESFIDEVYFSPNLGIKFQSRKVIQQNFNNGDEEKLLNILKEAKKHNIKIEMAINSTKTLNKEDVNNSYLWCKNNNIKVDTIVTFNHLIGYTKFLFGDDIRYVCSYNQNLRTYEDLYEVSPLFDEVVIGNNFIRDTTTFSILRERGFNIRLLLNNGCSHNCLWCSTGNSVHCDKIFYNNLKKNSIEKLIALQAVFPDEIDNFYEKTGLIDSYKISSRSSPQDAVEKYAKIYFENKFNPYDVDDLMSTCLLANISNYAKKHSNDINVDEIISIKQNLIKEELNKIEVE